MIFLSSVCFYEKASFTRYLKAFSAFSSPLRILAEKCSEKRFFLTIVIALVLSYLVVFPIIRSVVQGPVDRSNPATWYDSERKFSPSMFSFLFLRKGMSYDHVIMILGKPHESRGSGIVRETWYTIEGGMILVTTEFDSDTASLVTGEASAILEGISFAIMIDAHVIPPCVELILLAILVSIIILLKKKGLLCKKKQVQEQSDSSI